jgi:excisionase family DNA binding protein
MPVERLGVKLYNMKEAAEVLGVSYTTIKNYHRAGRIKGQRIGRTVEITETELKKFIEGGGRNGTEVSK